MIRALYGGSFDPIHSGHLAVIDRILSARLAAEVHVVPALRSPLKEQACRAPASHRWRMLELALAGRRGVVLDPRELAAQRPIYTVETLAALASENPDDCWRLIVGADHAPQFASWHEPGRILELAQVVVVARGPIELAPPLAGRALVLDDFAHPAEATVIRAQLRRGRRPPPEVLPPAVSGYILSHGLYEWPGEEAPA